MKIVPEARKARAKSVADTTPTQLLIWLAQGLLIGAKRNVARATVCCIEMRAIVSHNPLN